MRTPPRPGRYTPGSTVTGDAGGQGTCGAGARPAAPRGSPAPRRAPGRARTVAVAGGLDDHRAGRAVDGAATDARPPARAARPAGRPGPASYISRCQSAGSPDDEGAGHVRVVAADPGAEVQLERGRRRPAARSVGLVVRDRAVRRRRPRWSRTRAPRRRGRASGPRARGRPRARSGPAAAHAASRSASARSPTAQASRSSSSSSSSLTARSVLDQRAGRRPARRPAPAAAQRRRARVDGDVVRLEAEPRRSRAATAGLARARGAVRGRRATRRRAPRRRPARCSGRRCASRVVRRRRPGPAARRCDR